MLLNEINDTQVASAFINPDQVQRRKDAGMSSQLLAKQNAAQIAQDKTSKDPLTVRIAALRDQLAQLILQKQNRDRNNPTQNQAPNGTQPPAGQPPR